MAMSMVLLAFAFAHVIPTVLGNLEVDALHAWRLELADPKNVMQSWNPTMVNPCNWFHVTCNDQNSVIRLSFVRNERDLGNVGLSGGLVPQLGFLTNLQNLEAFGNNLTGPIPKEIGRLKQFRVLDLHQNRLTGQIPASLGNLISLMYLRLNSNKLRGAIPREVLDLVRLQNLRVMNTSDNFGAASVNGSPKPTMTTIIQDHKVQVI